MPPARPRIFTWWALACLALLSAGFWADCLFGPNVPLAAEFLAAMEPWRSEAHLPPPRYQWDPLQWDGVAQFYPWRLFASRCLRRGELPLWNPHQFCGCPFLANGQSAVLYPPNWLLALVEVRWGMGLLAALHYFGAAALTYLFCRVLGLGHVPGLVAGTAWAYGGFMVTWTQLPSLMNSATWLPGGLLGIALVFQRNRWGVLVLAGSLALTVLAGHLQIAAYVWLVSGLYALARVVWALVNGQPTRLLDLGAGVALALLLAAGQLLPTVELARNSTRGLAVPSVAGFEGFHRARALQPQQLITLLLPNALGTPARGNHLGTRYGLPYSEHCGFVGVTTLLLAAMGLILSRTRHFAFFLLVAVAGLNVAMAGPLARWLYLHVPVLGQAGGFSRFLSVYTFAVAMIGGLGLEAVGRALRSRRPGAGGPQSRGTPLGDDCNGEATGAGGLLSWAGAVRAVYAGALLMLVLELLPWAHEFLPRCPRDRVYPMTDTVARLQQAPGRVVEVTPRGEWGFSHTPCAVLPPNSATVYGYHSVAGYDSLFPRSYREFVFAVEGGEPAPAANGNLLLPQDRPLWRLAGVTERVTLLGHRWVSALPYAFVAGDREAWCGGVAGLIDRAGEGQPEVVQAVQHQRLGSGVIRVQLPAAEGDRLLVVTETLYPGWQAWVDGRLLAPLEKAGGTFMGVPVAPGDTSVTAVFLPGSVQVGLFCSLVGLALWFGILAAGRHARREVG